MMHSITNDRAKTDNGTKYTGIRILAVLFWIAIWQFASMYLKQEILLASPVSVIRKLFELIFSGNFWQRLYRRWSYPQICRLCQRSTMV